MRWRLGGPFARKCPQDPVIFFGYDILWLFWHFFLCFLDLLRDGIADFPWLVFPFVGVWRFPVVLLGSSLLGYRGCLWRSSQEAFRAFVRMKTQSMRAPVNCGVMQLQPWQAEYNRSIPDGYTMQTYILRMVVDCHAHLGIVGHRPAGNLAAIHRLDSSWYGFPLCRYFVGS